MYGSGETGTRNVYERRWEADKRSFPMEFHLPASIDCNQDRPKTVYRSGEIFN